MMVLLGGYHISFAIKMQPSQNTKLGPPLSCVFSPFQGDVVTFKHGLCRLRAGRADEAKDKLPRVRDGVQFSIENDLRRDHVSWRREQTQERDMCRESHQSY